MLCLSCVAENMLKSPRQVVQICHQMLLSLDRTLILREKKQLMYHYQVICYESCHRSTMQSAAGFFPIDNSLILYIVSTVCNHLVAICQIYGSTGT